MLDIKLLFDKYKIDFVDRGPNVGKNHININCVYCKNDPSHHLAINLFSGQFYCYRNPSHAGNIIGYLLRKLEIPAHEYAGQKLEATEREVQKDTRDYSIMRYFTPAQENQEALDYLSARLFLNPKAICTQFDLRISKQGEYAGRLIIPLTIGFTARAMRKRIEELLRYKAFTSEDGFFLFKHGSDSIIICEGAIDAMRIASISTQFDVAAKCRMALAPAMLAFIRESNYQSIYNAPDGTVPFDQHFQETQVLRSYFTRAKVDLLALPQGIKDFGAMTESMARRSLPA